MIKTVIFDMDGLMFDTERLSDEGWYFAADKMNVTIQQEMLDSMKGVNRLGCDRILHSHLGETFDVEYLRKKKNDYIEGYLKEHGVPEKKGLHELLSYLKTHGYLTVLATGTGEEQALKMLKQADVEKYFDHLVFGNMVERCKPEPDIFLLAAEKAYTAPENCLVLEDSPNGIKSAHGAGCHAIMVPDRIAPDEELKAMADDVAESLEDVLEMMKTWEMTA